MARTTSSPIAGRPLTALLSDDRPDIRAVIEDHVASEPWRRLERALEQPTSDKGDLVEFTLILGEPDLSSAFLVQAATDPITGEAATRSYCGRILNGHAPETLYDEILDGGQTIPGLKRLNRARFITHQAMKVDKDAGGPYAAGAWLSWAAGAPMTAKRYARRALKRNPNQQLASEVLYRASTGVAPAWPRPR
jgi:hypothetical protein